MSEAARQLAKMLEKSKRTVFFGGAGVSTESGIPDFRSAHGLYGGAKGKSYEDMLHIRYFLTSPDEFWAFYKNVMLYPDARPNAAHIALARLEAAGKLDCVLTQNIDGLHQAAGNTEVYELHGTISRAYCMKCGKRHTLEYTLNKDNWKEGTWTPLCECGGILKPDVVLYEEGLDTNTIEESVRAISQAQVLIIGGTSLAVYPAASLIDYFRGEALVVINKSSTPRDRNADLLIKEPIGQVFSQIKVNK